MILGVVLRDPIPRPSWLKPLGLDTPHTSEPRTVHLGASTESQRFQSGAITVITESGALSGPDARAVADAYLTFGTDCVRRLRGRFRFVLHDAAASQLLAASSATPPWPLAYWSDSRTTVVSSRVLPMLRCPDIPRTLDSPYVANLVLGLAAMGGGTTPLRGIRRLCVGEALLVDTSGARTIRVDQLVPRRVGGSPRQLAELFAAELTEEMGRQLERGQTVLSLSGGLDSAGLAGLGLRRTNSLAALSFVAPGLDGSAEIDSLDVMERSWPRLRLSRVDISDAVDLPDFASALPDDPLLTPLALLPARMRLWSRAREAGARTVIEGEGGDELFSTLPTPLDALRRGHFLEAARHVLASSGRRALVEHALWLPTLPAPVRRAWLGRREPLDAHLPSFVTWAARERPDVREAVLEYLATLVHRPFEDRLNEWLSAPTFVAASLSRRRLASSFGLELEWPMLERSVLELILGLHAANAIHCGPQKAFLRDALFGTVPDQVRLAPKDIGLYRALIPRVLTCQLSREALRDERVRRRIADLVRFERIEAMLDGLAAGRSLGANALWQLECVVSFAVWYARASREYGVD